MKKGFTLIELLAVIIILGVVSLITAVVVTNILAESKDTLSETQKRNIEKAAETYYLKEGMDTNTYCIDIAYLISEGYIEGKEVMDPKTKEPLTGSVKITYASNQYMYEYQSVACGNCELVSGDLDTVGSQVRCGNEYFYVLPDHEKAGSNTVSVLAAKNITLSTTNPVQNNSAGTTKFSTDAYWSNIENMQNLAFVYNSSSLLHPYVEAYEKKFTDMGISLTATLVSYNQVSSYFDRFGSDATESHYTTAPSWLYSTSYWTGFALSGEYVEDAPFMIGSRGVLVAVNYRYYDYGIRPVLIISESEFN